MNDLRDHLFAALERLDNDELTADDLQKEIEKAEAISGVGSDIFKANKLPFIDLNKYSIGIELTNWGMLRQVNGKFYNYVNGVVPSANVVELEKPFKGFKFWYRYTDEQIESTRKLVTYLCETYDIPMDYRSEIWDIDLNALKNVPGIYTHNSVRHDKFDVYPCPRLIEMLKNL